MPRRFALILGAVMACTPRTVPTPAAATAPVELLIAATTDDHGWVRGWDYYADQPDTARGLTRIATVLDSVRRSAPGRVILVDAGDLLQGNPFAYVAARVRTNGPNPIIAAMNAMQYDAAAVGNHEFNYGLPYLRSAVSEASFPFLATNAYTPSGARAFPAWRIVERAGVRVGIIGATNPGVAVWDRENVRGQMVFRDIVPEVRAAVLEARAAGAEVIVVSVHSGLNGRSSYDTVTTGVPSENVAARVAREVAGIDLVVYGHSHQMMADTVIGSTMLMQPKNWATSLGVATLTIERRDGAARVTQRRGTLIAAAGHPEFPAVATATESAHRAAREYVQTPVGSTSVAWRGDSARVADTPLIDFILETERRAAGTDLASTAAFSLDATLDAGPITIAELARLYPYDNTLRAVRITGRQLREYLEQSAKYFRGASPSGQFDATSLIDPTIPGYNFDIVSGVEYVIDLRQPIGSRITSLSRRGVPIRDDETFTMALNNYRQTGGGGYAMLADAPVVYDRQEEIRQLLIDEVRRRGTLRPEDYPERNWRIEPSQAIAPAYAAMRGLPIAATPAPGGVGGRTPPIETSAASRTMRRLRIISTNDFHGALDARTDASGVRTGGGSAIASAIERARTECKPGCETILLDGGDEFQGTPISNLSYGRRVVELYNLLDYSAAALGNHEFDWGIDTLRARMRAARYRIMAANVRYTDGRDVEWIPNDTIVTRGSLRIGVIGIATQSTPVTTRARNVAGLRFDAPAPVVDSIARALRARGAGFIVVVGHVGGTCAVDAALGCAGEIFQFAQALTEPVDAIVSGHSHTALDSEIRGMPIVQGRSSARAITVTDIPLDEPRGSRVIRAELRPVLTDSLPGVPAIDSMVARWRSSIAAQVNQPVARFATAMPKGTTQYALGNYVADAQRWAAKTDVAVMNNGGIRTDLLAGQATYGTLFEIQPFANILYHATIPGSALREFLERIVARQALNAHVSGLVVRYDPARPAGSRIIDVTMSDGKPLDDRATYTITLNDFLVTGGDGLSLPAGASQARSLDIIDLDALIEYSRSRPQPVVAPTGPRLIAVPR
jgi:2',3'-cyclic-nucleotide 2'-phosphodiesterase (5'-nucleotidase family)